jgi:hypothetical protein
MQEIAYVQARQQSPPPVSLSVAQAQRPQEAPLPQLWETLPLETRRRLSQLLARVIARHSLPLTQEVGDD